MPNHYQEEERIKTHLKLAGIAVENTGFPVKQQQLYHFMAASRRLDGERDCYRNREDGCGSRTGPVVSDLVAGEERE
ncbi:hypothetical protein ACLB2K_037973 [Fragaria x ananassa]